MHKKMAKTYRRHRRANRTRRGGGPKKTTTSTSASASASTNATTNAPATNADFQALMARVKELGAQAQSPIKPSKHTGISKSQAAEKRFKGIMAGKVFHSTTKSASKHGSLNRAPPRFIKTITIRY
jgi:hypothetical protein